jgi:hypothetical protein
MHRGWEKKEHLQREKYGFTNMKMVRRYAKLALVQY